MIYNIYKNDEYIIYYDDELDVVKTDSFHPYANYLKNLYKRMFKKNSLKFYFMVGMKQDESYKRYYLNKILKIEQRINTYFYHLKEYIPIIYDNIYKILMKFVENHSKYFNNFDVDYYLLSNVILNMEIQGSSLEIYFNNSGIPINKFDLNIYFELVKCFNFHIDLKEMTGEQLKNLYSLISKSKGV